MEVKVKMLDAKLEEIKVGRPGEWIDLRVSNLKKCNGVDEGDILGEEGMLYYRAGDVLFLGLGIATELPEGYEAIVNPRSSTFKNYGFLLTNSQGVIDNTYRGEWGAMVLCTRNGVIRHGERFLQFRVQKQQDVEIKLVDQLSETERGEGGFGSTGVN